MQPPADRADTCTEGFFLPFLITASFAVSFATLAVLVFHVHLPLFISSEMKAPALAVVLAIVFNVNRSKSFSLRFSSSRRLVRSSVLKMLIGS